MKIYMNRLKSINIYSLISIVLMLITWHYLASYIGKDYILPTPLRTLDVLLAIITSSDSYIDIFASIFRLVVSFSISFIMASILGLISGLNEIIENFLNPLINVLRTLPTMVSILVMLIWFGSEKTTVFVGILIVFPIIYSNILYGVKNIDTKLINMGRVYHLSFYQMLRYIYLPSIHQFFITSIVSGVGLGFKVLIAAEVLSQPKNGIGSNLLLAKMNLNMDEVFAWALLIIILSVLMEFLFKKISYDESKDINKRGGRI